MARRRKTRWSYNTGERGRNWVRAYCKGCEANCVRARHHTGALYLEWREAMQQADGTERTCRRSALLKGVSDSDEAKRRADKLAARFAEMAPETTAPLTIAQLLKRYTTEVTPRKGASKEGHDRRAQRVWTAYLEAQPEADRRTARHPRTMDRLDWERFAQWRRDGQIPGWSRKVKNEIIRADLAFMVAVLNWALGAKLSQQNPWDGSIRRAQNWPRVKEQNPHRPAMDDWIRDGLTQHAAHWQLALALIVQREQRRRNSAVRQLRWSDIDLEQQTIRWRPEHDKRGKGNVTPLSDRAAEALKKATSRGIGEAPVFPAAEDSSRPTSRNTFQIWLRRTKAAWLSSIADETERQKVRAALRGLGYHGEKRAGVRDPKFRQLPPAIQEEIAGTNYTTLRRIYDDVTVDDMRDAWSESQRKAQ